MKTLKDKTIKAFPSDVLNVEDVKEFIDKIKSMMWDEEQLLSKKIQGHDWANGYSCACHDFRTCILDEISGFALHESKDDNNVKEDLG